jgi:membrane protease YdiL (CAAX protease family)
MHWLELPAVKWAIPLPVAAALAPLIWLVFRSTWKTLDAEALAYRQELAARGAVDARPLVALALVAFILTLQEFYGRQDFYDGFLHRVLARHIEAHPHGFFDLKLYDDFYGRLWWAGTRIVGYLLPLAVWPLCFPRDHLADFGLRVRGFMAHAWIYALCVAVMVPVLLLVSRQPDFADYYPMYKGAGRSWLDFVIWEAFYLGQFFTLELFFRGFILRALRGFGAGAIWAMVVPYCMIHYGKPYLEACAAIAAGIVLGSLAMRTRSIYAGFLVHGTVAVLMDVLALSRRGYLPSALAPGSTHHLVFTQWRTVIWVAWVLALAVLAVKAWRSRAWIVGRFGRPRAAPATEGRASAGASGETP